MTKSEFTILSMLSKEKSVLAKDVWDELGAADYKITEEWLSHMVEKKFIARRPGTSPYLDVLRIRPLGAEALDSEEKRLYEQSKASSEKKIEKASDRRFQLFNSFFQVAIGAALALVVEHIAILLLK